MEKLPYVGIFVAGLALWTLFFVFTTPQNYGPWLNLLTILYGFMATVCISLPISYWVCRRLMREAGEKQ